MTISNLDKRLVKLDAALAPSIPDMAAHSCPLPEGATEEQIEAWKESVVASYGENRPRKLIWIFTRFVSPEDTGVFG